MHYYEKVRGFQRFLDLTDIGSETPRVTGMIPYIYRDVIKWASVLAFLLFSENYHYNHESIRI